MNQNIQRGNKPPLPTQTSTSWWVSMSQSHHCSLLKVSSQGNRGIQEAHTSWLSFCPTPANTRCQSNPPHYRERARFPHCHPSSHQHQWPQTTNRQNLLPFGDLSPSPLQNGEGTNSQLVQRGCGSLLGRLSSKRIKQKTTSFVAPPLMSASWHGTQVPRIGKTRQQRPLSKTHWHI